MIEHVLNIPHLYFSYTYDLTHSLQRLHNTMPEFLQVSQIQHEQLKKFSINFCVLFNFQIPLHERADERFVWNRHLIRDLVSQPEMAKFVLPVMLGCELTFYYSKKNCVNFSQLVSNITVLKQLFRPITLQLTGRNYFTRLFHGDAVTELVLDFS